MANKKKTRVYTPDTYDSSKFHVDHNVERGKYSLRYGARAATRDQIRYYNTFFNPETGELDPNYRRPADAGPVKEYYSRPGHTRKRTPRVSSKPKTLPKSITSKFPSGTDFGQYRYFKQGQVGGKGNPFGNMGWGRAFDVNGQSITHLESRPYKPVGGKGVTFSSSRESYYGTKGGRSVTCTINGHEAFIQHLRITRHALQIQAHNFRVAVGKRAVKVFQDSFNEQRFNTAGGTPWASLASFTQRKREKRGTYPKQKPVLQEYLDLKNSIQGKPYNSNTYRVDTRPIRANSSKHKKYTGCWAYFHNEGVGTYGKGFGGRPPKPYIERKFMGHSTLLDIYTDKFMGLMAKRFLFDSVFLVK